MTIAETLGMFVADLRSEATPESARDGLGLHVFDAIGAAFAGRNVTETLAVRALVSTTYGTGPALALGTDVRTSVPAAAMLGAMSARCSEVDDIHLRGCVTPGAIVVPAAFALASTMDGIDGATFLAACAAGIEVLARFGVAIDGPAILYREIWPTYLCAGFGVAATIARLLDLDAHQTADALGIAATLAVGTTGRPAGKTSRWLTLGAAVQNGVLAAFAAQLGLHGDLALLDGAWSRVTGVALEPRALTDGLGERFEMQAVSFKPWCAAKQTIAATAAFRALLAEEGLDPGSLGEIEIAVPGAFRAMIDRPALPSHRQESFASVQYQLALAAFAPDLAFDVVRDRYQRGPDVARLMGLTHVVADAGLDALYPAAWPARVTVATRDGGRFVREVVHAPGDPGTRVTWTDIQTKIERTAGIDPGLVGALAAECRSLATAPDLGRLIDLAEQRQPVDRREN